MVGNHSRAGREAEKRQAWAGQEARRTLGAIVIVVLERGEEGTAKTDYIR